MRCTLGFNSEMLKWKDEFADWFIRRARTEAQYYARLDPDSADWSRNQNIVKLRNSSDVIFNNSLVKSTEAFQTGVCNPSYVKVDF